MAEIVEATIPDLVQRARVLADRGREKRVLLGIVGAPGSGKSTVSDALAASLPEDLVIVGMDGFHLDNPVLRAMGRREAKGAIDTFDVAGYVSLLRRLSEATEPVTYGPRFDRAIETSIGSAVPVPQEIPLVVTEGLYLLENEGGWEQVRALLDEVWFLEIDDDERQQRLVRRRLSHGEDEAAATEWVMRVDQANAERVARSSSRADLRVRIVDRPTHKEEQ